MVKQMLIFSLLISVCKYGISQEVPNLTPPSPESTSLVKFIETPVSHYAGLPTVSIPIYTINEKGVSIPVSVNYHARGIKVEEIASRVGIGWALNHGGLISRQIRGSADESTYGYLNLDIYDDFFTNVNTRNSAWMTYSSHDQYDFVPDQFYLDANGISGKFIFDQIDGQPVLQKFDNVTISYTIESSKIASFIVTDSKGNKYYFGKSKNGLRTARDYETTKLITQVQGSSPVLSNPSETGLFDSWHIMEIETPANGKVEFFYTEETPIYYRRAYDRINAQRLPESFFHQVYGHQYQLSEITFSAGKLAFTPSTSSRADLNDAYALDNIKLYDSNNNLKKQFQFTYSYTTSLTNGNQLDYLKNIESQAAKRLFLNSIQEKDSQNNTIPPYSFTYNSTVLPNRFSNSQDVWGYYNGANNGQYLTFFNYSTFNVDRTVNSSFAEAGLLNKITYPTGGYTQFTYEDNMAVPNPDLNQLVFQSTNPVETKDDGLGFLDLSYYNGREYIKPINIGYIFGVVEVKNFWVQNVNEMDFTFSIYPTSGSPVYLLTPGQTEFINLSTGNYYLKVKPKSSGFDPYNFQHAFNINLTWQHQPISEEDSIYAGGKRIQKLENKLEDNSIATIREYIYEDSSGESSGKIFGVPNCYSINKVLSNGRFIVFDPYGAVPGSVLNMGYGNNVGYSSVTEFAGQVSDNSGKTEYEFTDVENTGEYYKFPYTIPTDNEWLRGKPLRIKNYKRNSNGSYELVRKVENEYLYSDGSLVNAFIPFLGMSNPILNTTSISPPLDRLYLKNEKLFRFPLAIFAQDVDDYGVIDPNGDLKYKVHYLTGGTLDLKKSITTEYTNGIPDLVKIIEYFYDYNDHYQLSYSEATNSNGNIIKEMFHYPQDYDSGVQNFSTLISNNIVGTPIDMRTYNGSTLISGTQIKYNNSGQPTDVYKFHSSVSDVAFSTGNPYTFTHKATYEYNSYGNLGQIFPDNDIKTSILWDSKGIYPMAEVVNATYSQIVSLNGKACTYSSKTLFNSLKSLVPNAQISTFSYNPLFGMSEQTDANGVTRYFDYDLFGRLKVIKNDDGHIQQKADYNFGSN